MLERNFVFNRALDEIISGRKHIILGDRGSGKSSVFRFISHFDDFPIPYEKQDQYRLQADKMLIVSADDPISFIQNSTLFDDNNFTPEKSKMFWLLYVALLAGAAIYEQGDYINPANWKDLTTFLKSAGVLERISGRDSDLFSPILGLITKIGSKVSFSIAGIPITLEPSTELRSKRSKTVVDISQLLDLVNLIAMNLGQRLVIAIDKIDEIFKYEREKQERFIQGLFLALSYMAKHSNLSLMIFLRTDIFQIYDIQEKNKLVSRSLVLSWSQRNIFELLLSRVRANEIFRGLRPYLEVDAKDSDSKIRSALMIVFPEQVEGLPFSEWLINMMRNGNRQISPRQVILFLVILRDLLISSQSSSTLFPIFKDSQVERAMTRLSELSYEEVLSDFRVASTFIRNCRAGKITEFSPDEVQNLFSQQEGSIANQIELLEKLGFLERIVKSDLNKGFVSKFRIPDLYTRCWHYAP